MLVSGVARTVTLIGGVKNSAIGTNSSQRSTSTGPAYLLGGSTQNYADGLYTALGRQMIVNPPTTSSNGEPTELQQERIDALQTAAALIDSGNPQSGRAILEKLIDRNGNDRTAIQLVARSYISDQDYEKAESYYVRAAALDPDNTDLQSDVNIARALQKSDDAAISEATQKLKSTSYRTEGLKILLHLSNRSPDNGDIYLAMAEGFADARAPAQVLGALQEAVKYVTDDKIDDVLTLARDLMKEHPNVGLTHNLVGRGLLRKGNVNEAISEFKQAVDIAPENFGYTQDLANAYISRAQSRIEAGDHISAESDLNTAQAINAGADGLGEARARLAAYEARKDVARGMFTKALTDLNTAYRNAPDDDQFKRTLSNLYTSVAVHYQSEDAKSQALSAFTRAWELDNNNITAKRHVGTLSHERGTDALTRDDYDIAIGHLERAYSTDKTNTTYRQALAEAYNQRGADYLADDELDKAIADLKRGFALDPSNQALEANLTAAVKQKLGA